MEYYSGGLGAPPLPLLPHLTLSRAESEDRHGTISDSFNNNNIIMQQQDYIIFVHRRLSGNILIELYYLQVSGLHPRIKYDFITGPQNREKHCRASELNSIGK